MKTPRRIGVLGGMGPQATVLFQQKLIDAVPATDDSGHVPLIVDMNTQVPSRIAHLIEGTGEDPGPVLAGMARGLEAAGAEALAMPCNTAHHYAPRIRAAVAIPLIDMVALSVAEARRMAGPGGRVGVLASPAVQAAGIFDQAFAAEDLTPVYAPEERSLLGAIRAIKSAGACDAAKDALHAASAALVEAGAAVQFIACTELSLIPDATDPRARLRDTLDVLAEAVVAFANDAAGAQDDRKAG